MSISPTRFECPRCGLRTKVLPDHCPACGAEFPVSRYASSASGTRSPGGHGSGTHTSSDPRPANHAQAGQADPNRSTPVVTNPPTPATGGFLPDLLVAGFERLVRWRRVSGVVIAIDGPYMVKSESRWFGSVARVALVVIITIPMVIGGFVVAQVLSMFSGWGSSRRGRDPGFVSSVGRTFGASYLASQFHRSQESVPMRDVRVRDPARLEHLIRVEGDFVAGNFSIGDEVEVAGHDQHGTLLFRSGLNKRTRTKILVKIR